MEIPKLSNRQQYLALFIILATWFVYSRYYGYNVFNDSSPFTNPKGYQVSEPASEGSYIRILIPGYEDHNMKFFLIHSLPFVLGAFFFKFWTFRHSMILSGSVWSIVFLYSATFRFSEFIKSHPETYQCAATLITLYPLMGICMALGTVIGKVLHTGKLIYKNRS